MSAESSKRSHARAYAARRAAGTCVECGVPSAGRAHCESCAACRGEEHRETYALLRMHGLCVRCKADAVPGRSLCRRHARIERVRQRNLRKRRAAEAGRTYHPRRRRKRAS